MTGPNRQGGVSPDVPKASADEASFSHAYKNRIVDSTSLKNCLRWSWWRRWLRLQVPTPRRPSTPKTFRNRPNTPVLSAEAKKNQLSVWNSVQLAQYLSKVPLFLCQTWFFLNGNLDTHSICFGFKTSVRAFGLFLKVFGPLTSVPPWS